MQLPRSLYTPRKCYECSASFKSIDSRETDVAARLDRHMKRKHGVRVSDWSCDSVGGHCRVCWERIPPGEVLPHWRLVHSLANFAPFDHCIDPFTQVYNRQLVSGWLEIELTWSLQALGQDDWNLSTDDVLAFSF